MPFQFHPADGLSWREQIARDYPALPGLVECLFGRDRLNDAHYRWIYSPTFVTAEDLEPRRGLRSDDTVVPDYFGSTEEP
jgi:hypothetical protein